jgi:hypothetical protein
MTKGQQLKFICTGFAIVVVSIAVSFTPSPRVNAQSGGDSRVQIGLMAAPVHLNMAGRNPAQVGVGSYLVNVAGDCNGCHSAGPPTEYTRTGNPYTGAKKEVNPATYLGGGRDFGFLGPPANAASAHIISRNLTPDKTGVPEGGGSFDEFVSIMRTGVDPDNLHPTCAPGNLNPGCVPAPFNGNLLQIMPWPNFQDYSDQDLRAIYEYLKAVPCVHGNYPGEDPNRCG